MCVRECAVYGAGVLVGTRRKFWKEGRWEAGPGGKTVQSVGMRILVDVLLFRDVRPYSGSFQ